MKRVTGDVLLTPLSSGESATVFSGLLSVHDEAQIKGGNRGPSGKTCRETPSCLATVSFRHFQDQPIVVRGVESRLPWSVDIPDSVRSISVWIEFYQREWGLIGECVIDPSRSYPADGIPFVHVKIAGIALGKQCFNATDWRVFDVSSRGG